MPPGTADAFFWEGAAEHRLLVQRCSACGRVRHPPAPMCSYCGSVECDSLEASGRGRVHSWIVSRHPNRPSEEPRIVVLVELEEGTRLVSNLVDVDGPGPYDDRAVEVVFREDRGVSTPFFRLVDPEPERS